MAGASASQGGQSRGYGIARAGRSSDFRPIQAVLRYSRSTEQFTASLATPRNRQGPTRLEDNLRSGYALRIEWAQLMGEPGGAARPHRTGKGESRSNWSATIDPTAIV